MTSEVTEIQSSDPPGQDIIGVKISGGPLPLNFQGSPQEFQKAIYRRLEGRITGDKTLLGWTGATEPASDIGPWLKSRSWFAWDELAANYKPTPEKIENGAATMSFVGTPTANRTQTFPDKSGTVALADDVFIPLETQVLTGTAPVIDWDFRSFVHGLTGDTNYTHTNVQDGQQINMAIINRSTDYDVFQPGVVQWPGGTMPAMPAANTGQSVTAIYTMRVIDGIAYGEQDITAGTDPPTTVQIGGHRNLDPGAGGYPYGTPFGTIDPF